MPSKDQPAADWSYAQISKAEFQRLSAFIESHCGIRMPASKKIMLEARLRKRLRALGMDCFKQYCEYFFSNVGQKEERIFLVDAITTNKTEFFREPQHFEYLVREALPDMIRRNGAGVRSSLGVWSAGCSSGEEPYTLAMVLSEVAAGLPGFRFMVLGTDISTAVLDIARRAVYSEDKITPIPLRLRQKYLLRSKDKDRNLIKMTPELRAHTKFRRLNFMESDFGLREKQDIIFCRNVMIYFDRTTQENLINKLCGCLSPGGYLFLGHSETTNGLNVPLQQVIPTVYRLA